MSKKVTLDAMLIAASNLTIAEAIFGTPGGPNTDYKGSDDPGKDAFESFKAHLKRLEDENS